MSEPVMFLVTFGGGFALIFAIAAALDYQQGKRIRRYSTFLGGGWSWWTRKGWAAEDRRMRKRP